MARDRIELTGARSIVLPFSALDGAGIDIDSIRPLDVAPDRREDIEHSARSLAEVPRHERRVSYRFTHCRADLERLPLDGRTEWRAPTDLERGGSANEYARTLPRLPGADGLYRYTETRYRDREPAADGRYYWSTSAHILGESTFSAIRPETIERAADPFEHERETAGAIVELRDIDGRRSRTGADGPTDSARMSRDRPAPVSIAARISARVRPSGAARAIYPRSILTRRPRSTS